jgi:hypothetical protein
VVIDSGGKVLTPREAMDEGGFFYGRDPDGQFRYKDDNHMRPFFVDRIGGFMDEVFRVR